VSKSYVVEEVQASPGTLWSTITDVKTMPQFISAIEEVKVLPLGLTYDPSKKLRRRKYGSGDTSGSSNKDSDNNTASFGFNKENDIKEGFSWEETRHCPLFGNELKITKCVTSIGLISRVENTNTVKKGLPAQYPVWRFQKYLRINATLVRKSHHPESETRTIAIDWDQCGNDQVPSTSTMVQRVSSDNRPCRLRMTLPFH
jgi:hypothetical protein